jgi:hypothetical protein
MLLQGEKGEQRARRSLGEVLRTDRSEEGQEWKHSLFYDAR